jgi:hypothetical protein
MGNMFIEKCENDIVMVIEIKIIIINIKTFINIPVTPLVPCNKPALYPCFEIITLVIFAKMGLLSSFYVERKSKLQRY